jgi:hypothetical protein
LLCFFPLLLRELINAAHWWDIVHHNSLNVEKIKMFPEAMKKEFGNHLPRSAAFKTKEGHWAVPTQKYTLGKVYS